MHSALPESSIQIRGNRVIKLRYGRKQPVSAPSCSFPVRPPPFLSKREKGMGKYTRKCRTIGEVAMMEVAQVVGVRTRARSLALASATPTAAVEVRGSPKKRKVPADGSDEPEVMQIAYLELRSRKLVMTQRDPRSAKNSAEQRCRSVEPGRISRCSSISSCEAVDEDDLPGGKKHCDDLASSVCDVERSGVRGAFTPSSNIDAIDSNEMESTAERRPLQPAPETVPSAAEIEDFFATAERAEKLRFAARYNFDVDDEIPLEGRYEWWENNAQHFVQKQSPLLFSSPCLIASFHCTAVPLSSSCISLYTSAEPSDLRPSIPAILQASHDGERERTGVGEQFNKIVSP
ncbi:Cyclin-dependent kinase inhibitor 3 [Apostasia shenzhenica]|uniref:Cyclin-dependent kinase inhibitor 3 n=1 Tax=Apostasia shenzhenica TaxID=1088818 RepID=A0A2I0AVE1_9ASPA|nr:Cyclin-dependent kinase inhibitor 3 [Apostasia shenzhenica]